MKKILSWVLASALSACASHGPDGVFPAHVAWIDLTHSYDKNTLYWPNNRKGFEHTTEAEGKTPLGYYYSSYSFCTPEHGGTHLDAPVHFAEHRQAVDEIPLGSLTGPAVLIDVSANALADRDYQVSVNDIERWEKTHGRIPAQTIVLLRTGYGRFYPDRKSYFGTAKTGLEAIAELHFPGIAPALAQWLVDRRDVKSVGLDTPSLDYGQSKDFKTHRILLSHNRPGFENLANLEKLPASGFYVVALPMKIAKGSGGPLRIVAAVAEP